MTLEMNKAKQSSVRLVGSCTDKTFFYNNILIDYIKNEQLYQKSVQLLNTFHSKEEELKFVAKFTF